MPVWQAAPTCSTRTSRASPSQSMLTDPRLRKYLCHYAEIICAVTSVLLTRAGTPAALEQKDQLWRQLRRQDPWLYRQCRWSALGALSNLPGRAGRRVSILAYLLAQRAIGFS